MQVYYHLSSATTQVSVPPPLLRRCAFHRVRDPTGAHESVVYLHIGVSYSLILVASL